MATFEYLNKLSTPVLVKKLDQYRDKLLKENEINSKKFKDIPFGYGNRSYQRLKVFSFSKEDELKGNIELIEKLLHNRKEM